MTERIGLERIEGFLIEQMADDGVELIVGARRDPDWGVTVLVGLGGTFAEAFDDKVLLPADFDAATAMAAIRSLRAEPLFAALRGRPAMSLTAAAKVVVLVSDVMRADRSINEIDINPLRVTEHDALALDATIVRRAGRR
jgi:succinyl-CoA synthetase beta subunit